MISLPTQDSGKMLKVCFSEFQQLKVSVFSLFFFFFLVFQKIRSSKKKEEGTDRGRCRNQTATNSDITHSDVRMP